MVCATLFWNNAPRMALAQRRPGRVDVARHHENASFHTIALRHSDARGRRYSMDGAGNLHVNMTGICYIPSWLYPCYMLTWTTRHLLPRCLAAWSLLDFDRTPLPWRNMSNARRITIRLTVLSLCPTCHREGFLLVKDSGRSGPMVPCFLSADSPDPEKYPAPTSALPLPGS